MTVSSIRSPSKNKNKIYFTYASCCISFFDIRFVRFGVFFWVKTTGFSSQTLKMFGQLFNYRLRMLNYLIDSSIFRVYLNIDVNFRMRKLVLSLPHLWLEERCTAYAGWKILKMESVVFVLCCMQFTCSPVVLFLYTRYNECYLDNITNLLLILVSWKKNRKLGTECFIWRNFVKNRNTDGYGEWRTVQN